MNTLAGPQRVCPAQAKDPACAPASGRAPGLEDAPPARQAAFRCGPPVRTIEDVRRLERVPLHQAVTARSTYDILRNAAAAFGDHPALTFLHTGMPGGPSSTLGYRELLDGVHRTANLLHALGVGPRDAVAILLPGCLEYHLALWGGEAAGIVQPLNPMLDEDTLEGLMRATGAAVLIAYGSDAHYGIWSKALRLRQRLPGLRALLRVAPHDETAAPALPGGVRDFAAAQADLPADRLVSARLPAAADIAAYFHTGGTTGAPKVAVHTHGNQVFSAWASVQLQGVGPQDVVINGYPLFHVAGVLPASLAALSAGVHILIPTTQLMRNREVLRNYWKLVEHHRATSLQGVPTVLAALAEVPADGADISTLRYCRTGASMLPPELAARFERLFGLHVHESLGMTEMAGISAITPPGVIGPVGCVGFALPYARMRVVALDSVPGPCRDLPPGETGMVLFKSPNVFAGYLDAAATAEAFTQDGWLITGDLGMRDEAGRLHMRGRAKDLIIRGGHNIDPKAIEDALGSHPAVRLCAAVGAPDAYAGELPVAYATLADGAQATEDELLAHTAERVAEAPARPRRITILAAMPATGVGKIYKPELRRMAAQAAIEAEARRLWQADGRSGSPAVEIVAHSPAAATVHPLPGLDAQGYEFLRQGLQRLPLTLDFEPAPGAAPETRAAGPG